MKNSVENSISCNMQNLFSFTFYSSMRLVQSYPLTVCIEGLIIKVTGVKKIYLGFIQGKSLIHQPMILVT